MRIFTTMTFFGRNRHLFEDATLDVECWAVSNHILHTELGVSIDLPTHDLDMPRGLSHLAGWQHFCQHKNSFRNSFIPPHSSNEIIFGISSPLELLSLSNTSNFFWAKNWFVMANTSSNMDFQSQCRQNADDGAGRISFWWDYKLMLKRCVHGPS